MCYLIKLPPGKAYANPPLQNMNFSVSGDTNG
jgi:hypothetical protein